MRRIFPLLSGDFRSLAIIAAPARPQVRRATTNGHRKDCHECWAFFQGASAVWRLAESRDVVEAFTVSVHRTSHPHPFVAGRSSDQHEASAAFKKGFFVLCVGPEEKRLGSARHCGPESPSPNITHGRSFRPSAAFLIIKDVHGSSGILLAPAFA